MSDIVLKVRRTKEAVASLRRYEVRCRAQAKAVMAASLERTYQTAQSLCAVKTGETKRKMRKTLASDGLSYEMGFYESDFPEGFVPLFLEYGTSSMAAHPCIRPTATAERPRLKREMAEAMKPA